jgi:hypothetical protein
MKRALLAALVLVLLPAMAAFADFGIGGAAFFNSPYLLGQEVNKSDLNVDQVTFGGDMRLKLSILQGEALALYATGDGVQSLNIYLDAGLALDILLLRISAGVGPNFVFNIDEKDKPVQTGLNGKLSADVKLGPISVGLSYIMDLNIDHGIDLQTSSGLLGAQVLLWL